MVTVYPVILPVSPEGRTLRGRTLVRHLSGLARLAVTMSADRGGMPISRFPKSGEGRPLPEKGVYWSASHKRDFVAGAAAERPVGIDVEKIKDVRSGMYDKVAASAEWTLFGRRKPHAFFRCWTAKEAVLKIEGVGLKDLRVCRVVQIIDDRSMVVNYRGEKWVVQQHPFQQYMAAVACRDAAVRWIHV